MALDNNNFKMDLNSFPAFRPLLETCEAYAALSGGRFIKNDFLVSAAGGVPLQTQEHQERYAAAQECKDTVLAFELALKEGQADILQESRQAYRLVMAESVRNGMKASFCQLQLWPPSAEALGGIFVPEDDCAYEDMSSPLPVIAQKCFNEHQRRVNDPLFANLCSRDVTASFIVDFTAAAGMAPATMPETQKIMLKDFASLVQEWTQGQAPAASKARTAFLAGLGSNPAADLAISKVAEWWDEHWMAVGIGALAVGVGALALLAMKAKSKR